MSQKNLPDKLKILVRQVKKSKLVAIDVPILNPSSYFKIPSYNYWTIATSALNQISNSQVKQTVEVFFYATVAFAAAGMGIGSISGPYGLAIGGITGATCGVACAFIALVLVVEINRQISPGY